MTNNNMEFIARENIKKGDIIVVLWKKYCRRAKSIDDRLYGFSVKNVKKGNILKEVVFKAEITI